MSKVEVRRYPQGQAMEAALALRSMLASACERIEVAGSLRRKAPEVKDIELVAVPRIATDAVGLWGDPLQVDMLSALVVSMLSSSVLASSAESTCVLPFLTTCFGPLTDAAGFTETTWPVTSQSKSIRIAARCCLTDGSESRSFSSLT